MGKIYAGIGSRRTPANICKLMQQLGQKLAEKGAVLRSGRAEGADKMFEWGCDSFEGKKEIFLANEWYHRPNPVSLVRTLKYSSEQLKAAEAITAQHHPSWSFLKPYSRKLHTRNCFQVLGISLQEPANFVLCWTPDGARTKEETSQNTGGTGQAIRVASAHGVRVYNLAVKEDFELARSWVNA